MLSLLKKPTTYQPVMIGTCIAILGSVTMGILLAFGLLGPTAIQSHNHVVGGTVLFVSLYFYLLVGVFISLKGLQKHKDVVTFIDKMKSGILVSISCALVSVVLTYLFYEVIYPSYTHDMIASMKQSMINNGVSGEALESKLAEQTKYYSTSLQAKFAFTGNLITGAAYTLLLSLLSKSKRVKK
ncbi:hypothetical protein SOPP22_00090 [Shewanella sp. OPT22]|nr:hypothetical protein SOPP22_00090 [Shewanella sp. OPT22]